MEQSTAFVGLDVHKDSISVAMMSTEGVAVELGQIENTPAAIRKLVRRLADKHSRGNQPTNISMINRRQ